MKNKKSFQSISKYSTTSAISLIPLLALSSSLYAIERPAPAAQPEEKVAPAAEIVPANEAQPAIPIPMPEVNAEKKAFIGVFGEPVSDTLSAHLNLAEGIGLQLKLIADDSPAAKAGLKKHDIITSIAGKDISSQDDLRAAISDKKPGDEIELKYISKGNAATKNLTLGARPNMRQAGGAADELPMPKLGKQQLPEELGDLALPKEFLEKFPKEDREKLMKLFKGNLQGLDLQELQKGLGKLEGFDLNLLPKGLNPEMNKGLKFKAAFQSRVKMLDQDGSITLESTKDGKVIELLDKKGKLQYRGPYNTEAEKKSVPQEFRDRIENLGIENGIGLLDNPKMQNFGGNKLELNLKDLKGLKGLENLKGLDQLPKELQDLIPDELKEQMNLPKNLNKLNLKNLKQGNKAKVFQFKFDGNGMSSTRTDPKTGHRFTFKKEDKNKQVEVHDAQGKLLFDGPYNTDADKASVPNDLRDFLEKLDTETPMMKGNKIELKIGE